MADGRPKGVPDDAVQVPNDATLFGPGMGPNGTPLKKGDWHWTDPDTGLIQTSAGAGDDDPMQAPSDADKDSRGTPDQPAAGATTGTLTGGSKDSKK